MRGYKAVTVSRLPTALPKSQEEFEPFRERREYMHIERIEFETLGRVKRGAYI